MDTPLAGRSIPASMIRVEGLSRAFGDTEAVVDLDLEVARGETFGFLGPNGAGKSTTTRLLTTLLRPDAGRARVAGHDPVSEPLEVRRRIGYLPDELPTYGSYTAVEFLTTFGRIHGLSKADARERARELLTTVGLTDVAGQPVRSFSKGMKQRLGLGRALINDPEVLFLDEPASGLDPTGQRQIRGLMKEVAGRGSTVFLCSHDLAEVQEVCDRAGIIVEGRLVEVVPVKEPDRSVLFVRIQGDPPGLREAVADLPGLEKAAKRGDVLRLTFRGGAPRQTVAKAIQEAGAVLLDMREVRPDLRKVYERVVEGDDA